MILVKKTPPPNRDLASLLKIPNILETFRAKIVDDENEAAEAGGCARINMAGALLEFPGMGCQLEADISDETLAKAQRIRQAGKMIPADFLQRALAEAEERKTYGVKCSKKYHEY